MAVHKATRSNPLAQPQRHRLNPQPQHAHTKDPQLKSELFEAIRHLNRGFGVALSSFNSLQRKDRLQTIFPADFLLAYRNRTEELRALANRDLLRILAGREEHEAEHFGRLCPAPEKSQRRRRRS